MTAPPWAHTHLRRRDALGLVLLVLAFHLWLLAGTPQWLIPASDTPLQTQAFETRHIVKVIPAPRAASTASTATATRKPVATAQPQPTPAGDPPLVKPHEIEDLASQLTAPVALPETHKQSRVQAALERAKAQTHQAED